MSGAPWTDAVTYLTAADLNRLESVKSGIAFEVVCCYCRKPHTHDFGLTDPESPIITGRIAPCNGQPYTIRWD